MLSPNQQANMFLPSNEKKKERKKEKISIPFSSFLMHVLAVSLVIMSNRSKIYHNLECLTIES